LWRSVGTRTASHPVCPLISDVTTVTDALAFPKRLRLPGRCHGLSYQSQREPAYDRALEQANRLRKRLGDNMFTALEAGQRMGGFGSGRSRRASATCESAHKVDLAYLRPELRHLMVARAGSKILIVNPRLRLVLAVLD